MAVSNYSLTYSHAPSPFAANPAPLTEVNQQFNDLLYSPEQHQDASPPRANEPYSQPRRGKKKRDGQPYLPPQNKYTQYPREDYAHTQYDNPRLSMEVDQQSVRELNTAYEGQYVHDPSGDYDAASVPTRPQSLPRTPPQPAPDYSGYQFENYPENYFRQQNQQSQRQPHQPLQPQLQPLQPVHTVQQHFPPQQHFQPSQQSLQPNHQPLQPNLQPLQPSHQLLNPNHQPLQPNLQPLQPNLQPLQPIHQPLQPNRQPLQPNHQPLSPTHQPLQPNYQQQPQPNQFDSSQQQFQSPQSRSDVPEARPPGFIKVEPSSGSNTKTQIHAVLDYDDDYYDEVSGAGDVAQHPVTPLQGPILLRNGTVPVVPLYSYPTVNNGSYYQIPILWTALSLALGYELHGQVIRGVPCVKRNYQLYCPTAGSTYPLEKIESFIDENKALMKRMYGAFGSAGPSPGGSRRRRRAPGVPDPDPNDPHHGDSFFRDTRQAKPPPLTPNQGNSTNRMDACESKTEIVTPYWALNSARKIRAIVNTMHFEQAIHQEVCSKSSTARCAGDCGCEQKYKWHRLLAYDPDEDCSGIFMDWFLFPSCCVCRCNP